MTLTTLQLSNAGLRVAYRDSGSGAPLVLLHGVGLQSAAWAPQSAALQDRFRVIALDLPGHGGSDPLPVGSTLEDFVAWCRDAIEMLGLGPVNLAGHSMGALIAGGVAACHPDVVTRVALLNGVYNRAADARAAVVERAAQIRAGQVDPETPLSRWFGDTVVEQQPRTQVAGWLNSVDTQGYATAYTAFATGDATYADRMPGIACPFLALTGDGDLNSTPAMSDAMAACVPDGTSVVVTGHRHMVNLTAPDVVNAHLRHWLAQPLPAPHPLTPER